MKFTILTAALLSVASAGTAQEKSSSTVSARAEYFPMPPTGGGALPFSEAVKVGDMLYVSGQIGNLPGTLTLPPGGIGPEARRALENIKGILERATSHPPS